MFLAVIYRKEPSEWNSIKVKTRVKTNKKTSKNSESEKSKSKKGKLRGPSTILSLGKIGKYQRPSFG